jgi:AP-3 complex subunit mu
MPKFILNCTVTVNQGRATFDPVTKILLWDVGKIDPTKLPNMRGQIHIQSGALILQSTPSVNVSLLFHHYCIILYLS